MKLIGIDPGRKTGMVLLEVPTNRPPQPIARATHDPFDVVRTLDQFASEGDGEVLPSTRVVIEKYVPREGVYGKDDTAQTVIGMVLQWCADNEVEPVFQMPSERVMVTTAVLQNLGLWLRGHDNRHVMDATRHAIAWLVKMRHPMTMAKGWRRV